MTNENKCPDIDKNGNCTRLSDDTVKQPCLESPCYFYDGEKERIEEEFRIAEEEELRIAEEEHFRNLQDAFFG